MSKSFKLSRSSSSSTGAFTISSSRNHILRQSGGRKHKVDRVCCKSGGLTITRVARPLVEETPLTSWTYNPNELFQHTKKQGIVELEKKGMVNFRPIMEESVRELYRSMKLYWPDCFNFADLGCSLGPNVDAISPFPEIVESIYYGECRLILDLLANDISPPTIPCFVPKSESPQQCHGRLFPDNSVHFLHSSYHLNWLSQVPKRLASEEMINKGNICVAKGSPIRVQGAYSNQFETDLFDFLRSRSHEIVPGGRMLMSFMGANHNKSPNIWELLGTTLDDMMMEGFLEESTLDSLNIPFYAPCFEELRVAIMTEGSFRLDRHETIKMNFNGNRKRYRSIDIGGEIRGAQAMMKTLKTAGEVFFKDRLGDEIVSVLFRRHAKKVTSYLKTHEGLWTNHVVSLIKV